MTKDTDNDPDKVKEDTEDSDTKKSDTKKTSTKTDSKKASKTSTKKTTKTDSKTTHSESVTYSDEGEVIGKTQEERTADLYRANVVKYLIVPEDSDVELPVGIEKEMIVVNLPVKHAYVDSEESLNTMDELKLLKKIAAVGFDQDETDIDAVNEALEEEDMIYAGTMAKRGYGIAYAADACVIHSHNYSCRQQFHRNFDLGVSQADHPEIFEGVPSEGEGLRLVKKSLAYLIKTGHIWLVPKLAGQSGFKYMGYFLGKRYKKLPKKVILFCTMNREYWKNE